MNSLALEETLVANPNNLPRATTVPLVQVVAPATLPEGYEFEAQVGSSVIKVKVPPGGVEEGQKFEIPFETQHFTAAAGPNVPVGHWRDGLFDIFRYGLCHPHCWTGCFCHLCKCWTRPNYDTILLSGREISQIRFPRHTIVAAGQVIRRLQLTWYGRPGSVGQVAIAFRVIFTVVAVYFAIYVSLIFVLVFLDPNTYTPPDAPIVPPPPGSLYWKVAVVRDIFHWIYWIATTIVLTNLRHFVRHKYAIPAHEAEDCCCSCWCPCFVSAQLLRHTTDYDVYPATCCTETGIPAHVPSIV